MSHLSHSEIATMTGNVPSAVTPTTHVDVEKRVLCTAWNCTPKEAREIDFDDAEKKDLWAGMFDTKVAAPKFRTEYNLRGKSFNSTPIEDYEYDERRANGFSNF